MWLRVDIHPVSSFSIFQGWETDINLSITDTVQSLVILFQISRSHSQLSPPAGPLDSGSPRAGSAGTPPDRAPSRHPRPALLASGSPLAGGAGTPRDRAPSRHPRPAPLASGSLVDSQPLSDIVSYIISPSENFQLLLRPLCTPGVHTLRGSSPLFIRSPISLFLPEYSEQYPSVFSTSSDTDCHILLYQAEIRNTITGGVHRL